MSDQTSAVTHLPAVLAAAARRLRINDALRACCAAMLGALATMVLLVLVQRLLLDPATASGKGPLAFLHMPAWALWAMLGLALIPAAAGLAAFLRSRHGAISAALAADERLGLRARLSSAVALEAAAGGGPMSPALFADAWSHASALDVRRDFPLRLPRPALFLPPALIALGLALAFVPQHTPSGGGGTSPSSLNKEEIRQIAELMENRIAALERKPGEPQRPEDLPSEKLKDDMSKLVNEMKEAADREQAIAQLNKLLDEAKLAEQRLAGMEKLVRQMEQLEKLGDKADLPKGPAEQTAAAMARGDFKKAAEELGKLAEKLKDGKLTDKEAGELKRDLERLAKMDGDWKELSDELAKAAAELGEGDREQALEQLAEAMEDLKELAELLKELGADGVDDGQELDAEGERVQATEEMIKQLKDMLKNAQRCAVCKKLYCLNCGLPRCACEGQQQCQCQPGDCAGVVGIPGAGKPGGGSGAGGGTGAGGGGPGQGMGGNLPENPHDVGFQTAKSKSQLDKGHIIGQMWVKGAPTLKGDEKRAEYVEAHQAAAKAATEAVEAGRIPRE
ncbi:MAG TPA: hypothetical protein PK280_15405, partial [Planctomycetota bacterium]|nr:hypothetical protein [Planctomycetota bacterium]